MNKKAITSIPLRINRENLKKISPDANNTLQIHLSNNNEILLLTSDFFGKSANFNLQGHKNLPILKIKEPILLEIQKSRKPIFDLLGEIVTKAANEVINTSDQPNVEEIAKKVAELLSITLNEDIISVNNPTNYQDDYSPFTSQIGIKNEITDEGGLKMQRIVNIPLDTLEKAN